MLDMPTFPAPDTLDLPRYFAGRSDAWGMFEDRFGKIRRRFTVSIKGEWVGDQFELDETFKFEDGVVEKRVWRIGPEHNDRFTATADDVVGLAQGRVDGPVIRIKYRLNLKVGGRSIVARFDDRMMLIDHDTLLNRARLSKWGIHIGEVTILFRREGLSP